MKRRVLKFGGSNLKEPADIRKLVRAVNCYSAPPLVVVSALHGVTDTLVRAVDGGLHSVDGIYTLIKSLIKQHQRTIDCQVKTEKDRHRILQRLTNRVLELERILLGCHYLREVPGFARDQILSYGERLSSLLISDLFEHLGTKSRESLPEDLGLTTDGVMNDATVDLEASRAQVKSVLRDDILTVVPGFYGMSPEGKVTLLGRGGSDYSAAALAACLEAEGLDIWKDVPGFMSADPKIVLHPVSISRLSYREAAELSYFGARILHPRTFEPLMEPGIPVRLYDINHFDDELTPLTEIVSHGEIRPGIIKSVTFSRSIGLLTLGGSGVGIRSGLLAAITGALHQGRINIRSVFTSQTTINLLLDLDQLTPGRDLIRKLRLPTLDEIRISDGIALVAVVGEGMPDHPGIAARIFSAVSHQGINIRIISSGASTVAAYFIIDDRDLHRAVSAIHEEFFS